MPFPESTTPADSRAEVFLRYLDYFRSRLAGELEAPPGTWVTWISSRNSRPACHKN